MEKNRLLETIHSRRSVRKFEKKPIEKEHLDQILDAARVAPSGGNLQGWRFIVLRQRELILKLEAVIRWKMDEFVHEFLRIMNGQIENPEAYASSLLRRFEASSLFFPGASVTIAVCYKLNPYNRPYIDFLIQAGKDRYEAHQLMGYVEVQSVAAATQNMILTAHSLGYGSCWMNVPFIAIEEIKEMLGILPPWELSALIPIGHPDPGLPPGRVKRKVLDDIVTFL